MDVVHLEIEKGKTGVIEITVTGVTDWTNILAKLVASTEFDKTTPELTLTGNINSTSNLVTFSYAYADTYSLTERRYYYEVILYKEDKTYIRTSNYGMLTVKPTIKVDPTV